MNDETVAPRSLPFHLLEEMTNNFSEDRKLGSGAFGHVYMGVDKHGKKVAVKKLRPMLGVDDEQFEKEYRNLASLHHNNIVQLIGYCHETRREYVPHEGKMVLCELTHRLLCFEYMHNGSLDNCLCDESSGHDWCIGYAIIKGICEGLKYLHEELEHPIYHFDLKPANILLDDNMIPKIADFGLSRLSGDEQTRITTSTLGTLGYLPPEYIERNVISNKLDIFSLGVVIIKIMAGPKGYYKSVEMSSQQFIELVHGNWRNRLSDTLQYVRESYSEQIKRCMEIALTCVDVDRHKRPTIGDIIDKLNETEITVQVTEVLRNDPGSSMGQGRIPFLSHIPDLEVYKFTSVGNKTLVDLRKTTSALDHNPYLFVTLRSLVTIPLSESDFLDVQPRQLRFSFEPNMLVCCPLRLTNNTDDYHIAFRCIPMNPKNYYKKLSKLHGILPPRSTHTYAVTMERKKHPPANIKLTMILESCVGREDMQKEDVDDTFFKRVRKQSGGMVHEVTLTAICVLAGNTMTSEVIRPGIKVIDASESYLREVTSMDVHPTEPWILAGYVDGHVCIWNYHTRVKVMALDIMEKISNRALRSMGRHIGLGMVTSIKFIVRKQWFVAGDLHQGGIHVHACMTMEEIKKFKAHDGSVSSLAVHPSQPFVLSTSSDNLIKLWNWEADWACIQTFEAHSKEVKQVMFNPEDGSTFASVSDDCTSKIWSISSPIPVATLDSSPDRQLCVQYFSNSGDRQYLITGSLSGTARIWDLQAGTCIRELTELQQHGFFRLFSRNVGVINSLRDNPILITASRDYHVCLFNSTTYRCMKTVDFGMGYVVDFAYIRDTRSLVIAFEKKFAVMEL